MHVVLVEPQIPQNTGSIARTCAAIQMPLHVIEPLGFDMSEKAVRRAGLDYWPYVPLFRHRNFDDFLTSARPAHVWVFSTHAERLYFDVQFGPQDAFVFGSETKGLGDAFLSRFPSQHRLKIPISCPHVRSLNLSNAVSIIVYEALRQRHCRSVTPPMQAGE